MSNLKIEQILPESTLEHREVRLPVLVEAGIEVQSMALLTYDLQILLETVQLFLRGQDNRQMLSRALKVLGSSLNDSKLLADLQVILKEEEKTGGERTYMLLALWGESCVNFLGIIQKFHSNLRFALISVIFSWFFLGKSAGEAAMKRHLSALLGLIDAGLILTVLKGEYVKRKEPFSVLIQKCCSISGKSSELEVLIGALMQFALQKSEEKVRGMLMLSQQNSTLLTYLLEKVPNSANVLCRLLKSMIDLQNVFELQGEPTLVNVRKAAVKEWLQQGHNYWGLVDKYYCGGSMRRRWVLDWGRQLGRQNLFSHSLLVKCLYRYFEGDYFEFDVEDRLVISSESHQPWREMNRSIGQCTSKEWFNLVAINVTHSVKDWRVDDPCSAEVKHKGLKKMVERYGDWFSDVKKQYERRNQRLQMAFSVLLVEFLESKKEVLVSFQQLRRHLDQGTALEGETYRNYYRPYVQEIKMKSEPRKDHNVIVEARLVRLLKRSKCSVSAEWLSGESGYQLQVVQLCLKRLCAKGLSECEGADKYCYVV